MKKILLLSLLGFSLFSCNKSAETELVIIGTVHKPIESFNPDSLYNILTTIKPDVILAEGDSSFFDKEFTGYAIDINSNESQAIEKYLKNFDKVLRPYDFNGRNEYRIKIGSRPTDKKAYALLDSLYDAGQLNKEQTAIYDQYKVITDELNSFAYAGAKAFNNTYSDSIGAIRQHYSYEKLNEIMEEIPVFANTYHVKPDGDSISYLDGHKLARDFWHMRNKAMAKHILSFVDHYRGKKLVVLNGYYHRYYLQALIQPEQEVHNFKLKEFYDY